MKYLGKNDQGDYEVVDLEVEHPAGPTIINTIFNEKIIQVTANPGEVIVRLASGGWPIIFTEEAFQASFQKIED